MILLRSYSFNPNSNCTTNQTGSEDCSDDFSVGLIHLPAGSEMPQHGEEARVLGRRANYNSFEIDFARLSFLFHDLIRFSLAKIEENHLSLLTLALPISFTLKNPFLLHSCEWPMAVGLEPASGRRQTKCLPWGAGTCYPSCRARLRSSGSVTISKHVF